MVLVVAICYHLNITRSPTAFPPLAPLCDTVLASSTPHVARGDGDSLGWLKPNEIVTTNDPHTVCICMPYYLHRLGWFGGRSM